MLPGHDALDDTVGTAFIIVVHINLGFGFIGSYVKGTVFYDNKLRFGLRNSCGWRSAAKPGKTGSSTIPMSRIRNIT